jgi:Ran-binding protein 3
LPDSDEKPSTSAFTANQELNGCASLNSSNSNSLSLEEAAKKYEEARGAQKRKYDEVETITGEENEINILEINCKLFTFINQNWEERGRGMLRLNDTKGENKQSRVVFRASGSLRVFLNTKVWSKMVCEQASQKSLRLTAIDATGQLKIFLVMGRNEDINILFNTLSRRINLEKKKKSEEQEESEEPAVKKTVVEGEKSE